jgi:hypothetical protein
MFVFILMAYLFTIRYDSIKNLIKTKQYDKASKFLMLVYKNCNESNSSLYIRKLDQESGENFD